MDEHAILPLGQHPLDPVRYDDIDPISFFIERLQTLLMWIDEHRASFEGARDSEKDESALELRNLKDATVQAVLYHQRLMELLLTGHAVDPNKRHPKDLCSDAWLRLVRIFEREKGKKGG